MNTIKTINYFSNTKLAHKIKRILTTHQELQSNQNQKQHK